jgi:CBS domain-containing protein
MTAVSNATPLFALDAVVFDSETTGLDPAKARIVELGAARIVGGRLDPALQFRRLVRPDEPIPPEASRIHGIDDAAVSSAQAFGGAWPEFLDFAAGAVIVGHTLGFDLAVLKRECARAGIPWRRPRTIDTRLLAEIANPGLPGYSLEHLAAWLGVAVEGRHSALGDAMVTARVFLALIPRLREGGIRTLAEAEQACLTLTEALDAQHRAGWVEAVEAPGLTDTERVLTRIDSYPFRHRTKDVMSSPARLTAASTSLGDALAGMARARCSSLFVGSDTENVDSIGIITERDVMRALATHGANALGERVESMMSRPLITVPADAFIYRAIGRMNRFKIRHLGVVDDDGRLVGALSARDLLRLRADEAIVLGDEIDDARDIPALGRAWAGLPRAAASLRAEGVSARDIAAVISREVGAVTRQAAIIAEQRMRDADKGPPPCSYALAVLGSAGRGESLLAMDQDNALVFADGAPGGAEDRWFEAFAGHVADILNEVGVPYCKGGVMAKNPLWRGALATWRSRIGEWIGRTKPEDLLSIDIFFDLRGVHGDMALASALWRHGFEMSRGDAAFAKLLGEAAGSVAPGLGFFGRFKTDRGRMDLKSTGLFGIVTAARVLAIRHHVLERATPARLAGIKALGIGSGPDLDRLDDAQDIFLGLILDQQLEDIERGRPPTNAVTVKRLSRRDRERLHAALEAVAHLDDLTRDLLFST